MCKQNPGQARHHRPNNATVQLGFRWLILDAQTPDTGTVTYRTRCYIIKSDYTPNNADNKENDNPDRVDQRFRAVIVRRRPPLPAIPQHY
ncbi:Protein of unknown function [Pyronema omphalodes CBS 100304]|uniref:Uncharacterized protein n=1 Tax=Pyronema omphalodes (strain CBS 100304) TaxID=1076935 RepID=U4LXD4_PYROM|nr:Protein of unknown function [Pyronema omphalodes CBS 100304]